MGLNEAGGRKSPFYLTSFVFQKLISDPISRHGQFKEPTRYPWIPARKWSFWRVEGSRESRRLQKVNIPKIFFFVSSLSLLIRFSSSSYPDKVRGSISNSSLFMLRCLFVVSRGSERGWSVR